MGIIIIITTAVGGKWGGTCIREGEMTILRAEGIKGSVGVATRSAISRVSAGTGLKKESEKVRSTGSWIL